jgi:integrase
MMPRNEGTLLALTGGVALKKRVQHPKVHIRKDRGNSYWFFRYWLDEILPDGSIKTSRKFHTIGPSCGESALGKKAAESERTAFLAKLNVAETRSEAAVVARQPDEPGAIIFGKLAQMWRSDYVERQIGDRFLVAATTRAKYTNHLQNHIMPRWKDTRLAEFRSKDVIDWLHTECTSWNTMCDLRNIMSGIFTKAQEWEVLPETYANPMRRVKLPKKWDVREKRILTEDQTARVVARLEDPIKLIVETCLDTGTRISEALGLQIKHIDLEQGLIRIDQRNWRGDIDVPKTERSKRTLALGSLTERYKTWITEMKRQDRNAWMFPQVRNLDEPMWDSSVRDALKKAAVAEECDFLGFGPHTLRRANITRRQEVGGSSIETSQIAGHANTKMTEQYTVVDLDRQNELTRRIQEKRRKAGVGANVIEITRTDSAA